MTVKASCTAAQWQTLLNAPLAGGMAVAAASLCGPRGLLSEMKAMDNAALEMAKKGARNELMRDITAHLMHRRGPGPQAGTAGSDGLGDAGAVYRIAVAMCSDAAAILATKATCQEEESDEQWLLSIGMRVAQANKEPGSVAVQRGAVTPEEGALLGAVAAPLRMARGRDSEIEAPS